MESLLIFAVISSWISYVSPQVQPVNRMISVGAGHPTPNIACLIGFHSIDSEDFFRVNCSDAHKIEIPVSYQRRKELQWNKKKKTIRFGCRDDNSPWPYPVKSWVCHSFPEKGTVTYNCIPENEAPDWFKKPIPGPAPGPYQRRPGCNGFVCYCNHKNYCNDKERVDDE